MKNFFKQVASGNVGDLGKSVSSALGSLSSGQGAASNDLMKNINLGNLLGAAGVGGILGALIGGKKAKKMMKGAAKMGGVAAAGALAWKFYEKWSQSKSTQAIPQAETTIAQHAQESYNEENRTALVLLEAMVFAARADGHIDETEQGHIHNAVEALFPGQNMSAFLDTLLQKPVDPIALAAKVHSKEEAQDLYRLSCAVIVIDTYMERSYLDGLAEALQLQELEKNNLEKEALAAQSTAN